VAEEPYLDRNFTSGWIQTKNSFSSGKLDIRAAMPKGRQLFAGIVLYPKNRAERMKSIKIALHTQTNQLDTGIYFEFKQMTQISMIFIYIALNGMKRK